MKFDGCDSISESKSLFENKGINTYPLTKNISYCPWDDDPVVLVSQEIQIFLHSRYEGIRDVWGVDLSKYYRTISNVIRRTLTHLINIPSVPNVNSVKSNYRTSDQKSAFHRQIARPQLTLRRNFLSSFETSAESQSHPFQLLLFIFDAESATTMTVVDTTLDFSAII